jgi:hypothetical protein
LYSFCDYLNIFKLHKKYENAYSQVYKQYPLNLITF